MEHQLGCQLSLSLFWHAMACSVAGAGGDAAVTCSLLLAGSAGRRLVVVDEVDEFGCGNVTHFLIPNSALCLQRSAAKPYKTRQSTLEGQGLHDSTIAQYRMYA